jgi:hypothetical protein
MAAPPATATAQRLPLRRPAQVILSHTPFRALAPRLGCHPVLVSGRRDVVDVAAAYGFTKVLTTYHLAAAYRDALPFGAADMPASERGSWARGALGRRPAACPSPRPRSQQRLSRSAPLFGLGQAVIIGGPNERAPPRPGPAPSLPLCPPALMQQQRSGPCPVRDHGWGTEAAPIRAVLVFNDPAGDAWYQDLQLLHDTITAHGVPLRHQPLPGALREGARLLVPRPRG